MAGPVATLAAQSTPVQALIGGVVIAGLNLVGASLVFVWRGPSERSQPASLRRRADKKGQVDRAERGRTARAG